MKILHYSHCDLSMSDAATLHVMEVAEGLARRGHEVRVLAPDWGHGCPAAGAAGIDLFPMLRMRRCRLASAMFAGFVTLLVACRRWKPDVVYTRRLLLNPLPGIAALVTGIPLVTETNGQIELHRNDLRPRWLWRVAWYPLLRVFEFILFGASRAVTADGMPRLGVFRRRYPRWAQRFHLVRGGGMELSAPCAADRAGARRELGVSQNCRLIVWAGTLYGGSGVSDLLAASKQVLGSHERTELVLVGDGPEETRCREMAASSRFASRIRFTGRLSRRELLRWLEASDVGVAPYTAARLAREDFTSYKLQEYLARGLPLVVTALEASPTRDFIESHDLGVAVPPGDPGVLAAALEQTLATPRYFTPEFRRRAQIALAGYACTWDEVVQEIEWICERYGRSRIFRSTEPAPTLSLAK